MVRRADDTYNYEQTGSGTYETIRYDGNQDYSTSFQLSWTMGGFTSVVITPLVSLDGEVFTEYTSKAQTSTIDDNGIFVASAEAVRYYKFQYVLTGSGTFNLQFTTSRMYA